MKDYKLIPLIALVILGFTVSYAAAEDGIYQDKQGVYIKFDSIELQQAAQEITNETGIIFTLGYGIRKKSLTTNIQASDWKTAISKLFTDYTRVEVWNEDLANSRIWILKENSGSPPVLASKPRAARKPNIAPENRIRSRSYNRRSDPPEVITDKTISTLPPHILMDPGVLKYLKSVGISLPEYMRRNYENMIKDLEDIEVPISPAVWKTPEFQSYLRYLEAIGIELPPKQD